MKKIHPFEAIYDKDSTILILGSMPSIASVQFGFYYMHPQNRFWKVLSHIFHENIYDASIEEKKQFLLNHHLALYDIIQTCDIINSSDQSIKNVKTQDVKTILCKTKIKRIILNGQKAYNLFIKTYPELKKIAVCLPSTSSANAQFTLDELIKYWKPALQE